MSYYNLARWVSLIHSCTPFIIRCKEHLEIEVLFVCLKIGTNLLYSHDKIYLTSEKHRTEHRSLFATLQKL
nr:MAG TPA: hypothetical protein [Caudoviricetes sp.]DAV00758.1 MAG TPA: hypothetical protein [Caudoviricetes sp.]